MFARPCLFIAISAAVLVGCNSTKPQPKQAVELTTFDQKVAYLQGRNLVANFQKYDLVLDSAIVAQAMDDAVKQRPSLLTDEQIAQLKEELTKRVKDAKEEEKQQLITSNSTAGEKFLAENKTKPGVQVLPSGVQYKVIKAGNGPKPAATDVVTLNYVGKLISGNEFESSAAKGKGEPVALHLDKLVSGFKEAVALMPVGSKWEIYIPAPLGYGDMAKPKIPPASTLIFEVELVGTKPAAAKPELPRKEINIGTKVTK